MPTLALGKVRVSQRKNSRALVAAYGRNWDKQVVVDEPRAFEIFERIISAWQSREGLLKGLVPPEIWLLDTLKKDALKKAHKEISPVDQALIIWTFARMNLSGRKAVEMAPMVRTIWQEMPWLMRPELAGLGRDQRFYWDDLLEVIPAGAWRPEHLEYWIRGLEILDENYGGDPRQIIYAAGGDRVRFCQSVTKEFPGIGHKIAQMIVVFFREWAEANDHCLFEEIEQFDPCIPVDVWWLRGLRQLDILTKWSTTNRESTSWPLSCLVSAICKRGNLPYCDLVQGTWHIFSRICGRLRPGGNDRKAAEFCFLNCPMNPYCNWIVPSDIQETNWGKMAWEKGRIIKRKKINSNSELTKPRLGL